MTKLFSNYKRAAIDFASAQGNYLTDTTGKTYLDFSSGIGVTNLGYHPHVNQALTEQVGKILHQPNLYYNQLQEDVADLLIGDKDYLAFFCNSGAEANEAAIKIARKASGKQEIITFQNSSMVEPSAPCLPLVRIRSNKVLVKAYLTLAMPFLTT